MTISTYAELKTAAESWQARGDITTTVPDAIAMCEGRLNRELGEVLTSASLVSVVSSRNVSISALSLAAPVGLFIVEATGAETEITTRVNGTYQQSADNDKPRHYSIVGTNLVFDCPADAIYTLRFEYRQRFALSDAAPTNWLLTSHPDIYLAATLVWGCLFTEDDSRIAKFAAVLEDGIPSIKRYISRQKGRGLLTIDPGLADIGRCQVFNYTTGQ